MQLLFFILGMVLSEKCDRKVAIQEFQKKQLNPDSKIDYIPNLYEKLTWEEQLDLKKQLEQDNYCGIKYSDDSKQHYDMKTFHGEQRLKEENYILTHKGICGLCSTLQDLSVYLSQGLTVPVRACGFKGFFSKKWNYNCLLNLGFTEDCAKIWLDNTNNTRKKCLSVCIKSFLKNEPLVIDGKLNSCIQCDEDKSGPVFQYFAGRTRRNSGIISEIDRPDEQVFKMEHCYY